MADDIAEDKVDLGSLHYYEVLDRCHIILENMEDHLLSHPAVKDNPEWQKWVEEAQSKIYTLYNNSGGKFDELFEQEFKEHHDIAETPEEKHEKNPKKHVKKKVPHPFK